MDQYALSLNRVPGYHRPGRTGQYLVLYDNRATNGSEAIPVFPAHLLLWGKHVLAIVKQTPLRGHLLLHKQYRPLMDGRLHHK